MNILPDFKVYDATEGVPEIKLCNGRITFNKACSDMIEKPKRVVIALSEKRKQVAVIAAEKEEKKAINFYIWTDDIHHTVRWNNASLSNAISQMCGWNMKDNSFIAYGKKVDGENIVIFDMNNYIKKAK